MLRTAGTRALGLGYVGSPQGGVALAARYFWQRHPTQIDIRDAAFDQARLGLWLWSPDAPPMDMRPYRGVLGMEEIGDAGMRKLFRRAQTTQIEEEIKTKRAIPEVRRAR